MTDTSLPGPAPRPKRRWRLDWVNRLAASRGFQRWAAGVPVFRGAARREGEALFDLLAGFVHSQVLRAIVELRLPETLSAEGPQDAEALGARHGIAPDRMAVLLRAGVALGLLRRARRGRFALGRRGAAMLGVPGLREMILHHEVLYRDLADPVAFLRGETETELAGFWPYVFGADGATDPQVAATYSDLMAQSQVLVAEDTLRAVSFAQTKCLLDIGGGTGAFLEAVGRAHKGPRLMLFDLPAVVPGAEARLVAAGLGKRARIVPGSFRDDPLPEGADTISLIRVLYDHGDATVADLLQAVHEALPPAGRLIVSEPMAGGDRPDRAGDAYFAFYTMAMRTGRARSAKEIKAMLGAAGFETVSRPIAARPYVTTVLEAWKAGVSLPGKRNVNKR